MLLAGDIHLPAACTPASAKGALTVLHRRGGLPTAGSGSSRLLVLLPSWGGISPCATRSNALPHQRPKAMRQRTLTNDETDARAWAGKSGTRKSRVLLTPARPSRGSGRSDAAAPIRRKSKDARFEGQLMAHVKGAWFEGLGESSVFGAVMQVRVCRIWWKTLSKIRKCSSKRE